MPLWMFMIPKFTRNKPHLFCVVELHICIITWYWKNTQEMFCRARVWHVFNTLLMLSYQAKMALYNLYSSDNAIYPFFVVLISNNVPRLFNVCRERWRREGEQQQQQQQRRRVESRACCLHDAQQTLSSFQV